jgi:hypothetical protein
MGSSDIERKCSNCEYYHCRYQQGKCRRYAPRPCETSLITWPEVNEQDWCGEFSQKIELLIEAKDSELIYQRPARL